MEHTFCKFDRIRSLSDFNWFFFEARKTLIALFQTSEKFGEPRLNFNMLLTQFYQAPPGNEILSTNATTIKLRPTLSNSQQNSATYSEFVEFGISRCSVGFIKARRTLTNLQTFVASSLKFVGPGLRFGGVGATLENKIVYVSVRVPLNLFSPVS